MSRASNNLPIYRQLLFWLRACVLTVLVGGIYVLRQQNTNQAIGGNTADFAPTVGNAPRPDLEDPAEDYSTFLYVLQSGGCEITRPAAIAWFDQNAREHKALSQSQSDRVLSMLEKGGHSSWSLGYRQHLFNSALNALHLSHVEERVTHALKQLALHDGDKVMRLYALQHLDIQRRIGQLTGPLAEEIEMTLQTLASRKDGEESGYALEVLASWDDEDGKAISPAVQELALATAADATRAVDVRVTALHAAGSASLSLSRTLAVDITSPVLLRKASIALIGHHGDAQDLTALSSLQQESSRLAQAAEPAQLSIRKRIASTAIAEPVSY